MKTDTISCIIVDDSPEAVQLLTTLLSEIPYIQLLGTAHSAADALPLIIQLQPDLLFLDVEMPGKTGFELVEELRKVNTLPIIIFTTAYEKYAINAIRCAAFDYLLKPVDPAELKHVVALALARQQQLEHEYKAERLSRHLKRQNRIKLPNRNGFALIDTDDIFYVEADWNYSTLYIAGRKCETVSMNIGSLENILPPDRFFRISRSIIIQIKCLQLVDRKKKQCLLKFGDEEKLFDISARRLKDLDAFKF